MRRNLKKITVSMAILMLIASVLPVLAYDVPGTTHPANAMWIEPATITNPGPINYRFNVTVFINVDTTLAAWQFDMWYNKNHLACTGAWFSAEDEGVKKSELFVKSGTPNIPTGPIYSSDVAPNTDSVLMAEVFLPGTPTPPLPGPTHCPSSLAYVEFKVVAVPTKGELFESELDITTSTDNYFQDPEEVYYRDIGINADYTYTWSAPEKPWFALDPSTTTFTIYDDAVSTSFDVDVIIDNYYAGWGMTNATFCLLFDDSLNIESTAVVWDPDDDWTSESPSVAPGEINGTVTGFTGTQDGGAPVRVCTITFHVHTQGPSPPINKDTYNETKLEFCDDTEIWDHEYTIDDPAKDGWVRVHPLLTLPLPYLAVIAESHDVVLGPEPSVGKEFTVKIDLCNLHFAWYLVGVDFKMTYCPDLMEVVDVEEGPYLPQFEQTGAPQPTIFTAFDEGTYITAMDLILPNATGGYPDPVAGAEPPENGTIAIITFRATAQDVDCDPETLTCDFDLYDAMMVDKGGNYVPFDHHINGTYTMLGSYEVGRRIDLYTQYPDPYGGQGQGMPSDMFWPQKEVILYAEVTYNCWPVQQKLVTFNVFDNEGHIWTKLQGVTDKDGVATASFRLPWPCDDPESLLGLWKVTADVDVACEVIVDELEFHYDYLVNIIEVTTDKYYYEHCDWVDINVILTSHAQQEYTVAIRVTIHDDLNVPIATTVVVFDIGGAQFCTAKQYEKDFRLHIDKFAYVGGATIHAVPVFMWMGKWTAAGPEGTASIYILPN